jgi:hypothetical protein
MQPLEAPKTLKIYQLVRMSTSTGLNFSTTGSVPAGGNNYIGSGFYLTQSEAEQNRTLEVLKDKDNNKFYVFELEVPNPAYQE